MTNFTFTKGDGIVTIEGNSLDDSLLIMGFYSPGVGGPLNDFISYDLNGNDLIINLSETDRIILKNHFANDLSNFEWIAGNPTFHYNLYYTGAEGDFTGTPIGEAIYGGTGDNFITGGDGDRDGIVGGDGNDLLWGEQGKDSIWGGRGNDLILGGEADDILYGGSGDDKLSGGEGIDLIHGGPGNDILTGGYESGVCFRPQHVAIDNFSPSTGWLSFDTYPRLLGDFDADGDTDILGFGSSKTLFSASNGIKEFLPPGTAIVNFANVQGWTSFDKTPRLVGDFDGDGKGDIIGFGTSQTFTALSSGNGTFSSAQTAINNFSQIQGWSSYNDFPRLIGDVNGDGLSDIVGFGSSRTFTSLSNGDGTFASPQTAVVDFSQTQGWSSHDSYPRMLGDFNGDGNDDIIGFGSSSTYTSLANGDGTFASTQVALHNFSSAQGWTSFDDFPRIIADLNGDGLDDIVGFGSRSAFLALSNGDGTFSDAESVVDTFSTAQGWTSFDSFPRFAADVDNDGDDDLIGFGSRGVIVHLSESPYVGELLDSGDMFVFSENTFGRDIITDFEDGSDLLDLSGTSFSYTDLVITSTNGGQDTIIDAPGANNDIILENVSSNLITEDDFIF